MFDVDLGVVYVGHAPIAMTALFNGFKGLELRRVKLSPTSMSIIDVSRRDFGLWQLERWNFGKVLVSCGNFSRNSGFLGIAVGW